MKRPRKKRSAKISEAVFLGKKGIYKFDVYLLGSELPDSPAVFVLSRRKVDKIGKASHAASCIGETASITAELKKHKRAKCVKQNAGNVVCILTEESEKNRSAVLDDIAEARTFSCVRNAFEPTMLRKPKVPSKKALQAIPAVSVDLPLKPKRRKRLAETQPSDEKTLRTNKKPIAPVAVTDRKRSGAKRRSVSPKPARSAGAKAKKPKTVAAPAKRRAAAKPRTRVQGGVDRDRGQHRLSKPKRAAAGRTKTRTARNAGTRKKAAA
jgi:hypothetical protein